MDFSKRFGDHSWMKIVFLCFMGITLLLCPDFLRHGAIYLLAGYMMINGMLEILLTIQKSEDNLFHLSNLFWLFLILCGVLSIYYHRYMVSILPVYLGCFFLLEGCCYLFFTKDMPEKKMWLVLLAGLLVMGGIVLVVYSFGFGDLIPLVKITASLFLLSCIYEVGACMVLYAEDPVPNGIYQRR